MNSSLVCTENGLNPIKTFRNVCKMIEVRGLKANLSVFDVFTRKFMIRQLNKAPSFAKEHVSYATQCSPKLLLTILLTA